VKRRRNPSQELINKYGKRLPYLVKALDKSIRYADDVPAWPPGIRCPSITWTIEDHGMEQREALDARHQALIQTACSIMETAWVTPSMVRNKKSPYTAVVAHWYTSRSITLPEDADKTRETLREFHELAISGTLKGDAANIDYWYHGQQDLAKFLRTFRKAITKGGLYEQDGCVRVAELGKYVLFRIDDYKTGEVVFKDTNWCVRAPDQFRGYGPPYFMVVNTNVAEGHDDRVCLMHNNSKQIKNVNDDRLARPIQKEIKPFMEYVFGRWACKYNMKDGDEGDLDIGDQWWPLDATTPFEAVGEIIDVLWSIGGELADISDYISNATQDQFYDDAMARYKKDHPDDDDTEGFEEWFEKWRDSDAGNKELGSLEDSAVQECDYLTREAFSIFAGLTFDAEAGMDYVIPQIFGTSWSKMKKLLNIRPNWDSKPGRHGIIKDYTVGGNARFNRNHATPKMEAWAERSIDRFITKLPDEKDFSRYSNRRDSGVWGSLAGAKRAARGY
jgi:hypothetical protein